MNHDSQYRKTVRPFRNEQIIINTIYKLYTMINTILYNPFIFLSTIVGTFNLDYESQDVADIFLNESIELPLSFFKCSLKNLLSLRNHEFR